MAKKKKVVVTTTKKKLQPTSSKAGSSKPSSKSAANVQMLFGRENFKFVFIGLGLITLGMILMSGGGMPSPDVWDESLIYSHTRITIAPMLIIAGLVVEIYAIFK